MPKFRLVLAIRFGQGFKFFWLRFLRRRRLLPRGPAPRGCGLLCLRLLLANRGMVPKRLKPILALQSRPHFVATVDTSCEISEWLYGEHLSGPAFRAATIQQRPPRLLLRKTIELLYSCDAIFCALRAPHNPQPADASVGINMETHMARQADILEVLQNMTVIGFKFRSWQKLFPSMRRGQESLRPRARRIARFHRAALREISLEVRCIHFNSPYDSRHAEFEHDPVMARAAPPLRFPAVSHVFRASRHQQVPRRAKKLIARGGHASAVLDRRKVDLPARNLFFVRHNFSVCAQPRDAAIRKNVQTQMRKAALGVHGNGILRVARK